MPTKCGKFRWFACNDIVTGIWKSGSVRITGQFKAKSDGGLGDVITLVKLSGRDQVNVRVTDVHEALIVGADGAKPAARGEGIETANREAAIRRKLRRPSSASANGAAARRVLSCRPPRPRVNNTVFRGGNGNEEFAFGVRLFHLFACRRRRGPIEASSRFWRRRASRRH